MKRSYKTLSKYIDVNMICNMTIGICQCRNFMKVKVNPSSSQCQLYLDVDCSKISYDSEPSAVVLDEAVNKTLAKQARRQTIKRKTKLRDWQVNQDKEISGSGDSENDDDTNDTEDKDGENENIGYEENITTIDLLSQDEVLANSLLSSIDPNTTSKSEMKEAFCRDVDTFSWDFMELEKKTDSRHTIDHLLDLHLEYDYASPALTKDKWKEEATKPSSNGPAPRWHGIIAAVIFCVCGVLVAVVLCCGLWQLAAQLVIILM